MSKMIGDLRRRWTTVRWWRRSVLPYLRERFFRRPLVRTVGAYQDMRGADGCDVMAEDWDTLIVLDACRYDTFERYNPIPGALSSRRSRGSATVEFLEANFSGGTFHDTVYVNAHPNVTRHLDESFHDRLDVWRDEWDDDLNTVPPGPVTAAVERAHERYPRKRLIVHYLQPHCPFIGPWARANLAPQAGIAHTRAQVLGEEPDSDDGQYAWNQLRAGLVSAERLRRAYEENLQLVLPHVAHLVATLDGKTVVTSDHGNLFGERVFPSPVRLYEHPPGLHADSLVTVPWLTVDASSRRTITAEPPVRDDPATANDSALADHLHHLGYATD